MSKNNKPEPKSPVAKATEAAEAVVNEVKSVAAKAVEAKPEAKKPEVKEEVKKDVAAVKETAQKAVKKVSGKAKKAAAKPVKEKAQPEIFLEKDGNKVDIMAIVEKVKGLYVAEGHRESSIKSIQVYVKPEDNKAYYVINTKMTGDVDLF